MRLSKEKTELAATLQALTSRLTAPELTLEEGQRLRTQLAQLLIQTAALRQEEPDDVGLFDPPAVPARNRPGSGRRQPLAR